MKHAYSSGSFAKMSRNFVRIAFNFGIQCWGSRGLVCVNLRLRKIKKKSVGVESRDRVGQFWSPKQETRPEK